jgi:hypothetical protein
LLKRALIAASILACVASAANAQPLQYQAADLINNTPVSAANPLPVGHAPYLSSQTAITAASGNVANANAVATLSGAASKTTFITGFRCQAAGSTAAAVVSLTVAGVITGTMTYTFVFPAGATTAAAAVGEDFTTPIPASAVNTSIVVTLPAGGAGNTNASCVAEGFQQ